MYIRSACVTLSFLYIILASTTVAEAQSYYTKRAGNNEVCVGGVTR
jgi:hypothetical protein